MPLPTVGQVITILPVAPATEKRQGICKFVGETQFSDGLWVGVELIGSQGKNNGTVNGVQYFNCEAGKGVFIRPELVEERSSETTLHDEESSKAAEELRAQLEEVTKQLAEKADLLEQRTAQIESLELDLEIAIEEKDGMKDDLDIALEEMDVMKLNTDPSGELERRAAELEAENTRLIAENEELQELAEAEAESTKIIETLQDNKMELEEKNEALLESLQKLRAEYDELQTFSTMQDEELAEQKDELQLHDEELQLLNDENADKLEEKAKEYATLKAELLRMEKDVEDLKASSSGSQQELAVQLRLLKDQNSDSVFRSVWDAAAASSFNRRFEEKATLTAAVQAAVPPLAVPMSRASSFSLSQHSRALIQALLSPEVSSVRRSHHVEAAIGLSAFHLKLDVISAGSGLSPLSSQQVAALEEVLLMEVVTAGHQQAQGVDHWKKVFARLQDISLPRPSAGSGKSSSGSAATLCNYATAAGASPLVTSLRFLVEQGCQHLDDLKSTLSAHSTGSSGEIEELVSQLTSIHGSLSTSFDPLQGVEKTLERVGSHNLLWTSDGTQTLLLATSEAHALVLPLMSMCDRVREVAESVKRGLISNFWSPATEQIFVPLRAVARVEGSILESSTNYWLPPTERGLHLKQLGNTIASGLKKLWNVLETAQQVSPPLPEPVGISQYVMDLQEHLKEVQQAEGVLSQEQAAEARAGVQKQLDDTVGLKDKALYEVEAQRARCKELESHVSRLKKSESDLSAKITKVTNDYQSAFEVMERDTSKVQDELKRQKKLAQAASSVAPLSQWERRQMKHTIEVYRAAAHVKSRQDILLATATRSDTSRAEGDDGVALTQPVSKALRQQYLSGALEWSTPASSLQLVGV